MNADRFPGALPSLLQFKSFSPNIIVCNTTQHPFSHSPVQGSVLQMDISCVPPELPPTPDTLPEGTLCKMVRYNFVLEFQVFLSTLCYSPFHLGHPNTSLFFKFQYEMLLF